MAAGGLPKELGDKPTVVMIQCVGSRNDEHPYCSRVCCSEAVKNALEIKRQRPGAQVFVLAKDIRTYGFREEYFQKAREAGVLFVRHPRDEGSRGDRRAAASRSACRTPARAANSSCGRTSWSFRPASRRRPITRSCRACCGRAHGRRVLPRGPPEAAAGGPGQRGRVHLRPGPFAAVHRRDDRAGPRRRRPRRHGPLEDAPGRSRPDRQGRPANCVACATCVKVCPYGAPMINLT